MRGFAFVPVVCALFIAASGCARAETQQEGGGEMPGRNRETVIVEIQGRQAEMRLADTRAARALAERLAQGEVVYTAEDYGGFEKTGSPGFSLPADDRNITANPGDAVLYQGRQIVLFYGSNRWAYTRLGSFPGLSQQELEDFLCAGQGNVEVTFRAAETP